MIKLYLQTKDEKALQLSDEFDIVLENTIKVYSDKPVSENEIDSN
jgi:hypothetical protein